MTAINFTADRDEIKKMLSTLGVNDSDHYLILDRLYYDDKAYQRYLNNAKKLNKQSSN